ncbi:MAG: GLUG motif-containing protein [Candidatus Omnitrophota bacterium]
MLRVMMASRFLFILAAFLAGPLPAMAGTTVNVQPYCQTTAGTLTRDCTSTPVTADTGITSLENAQYSLATRNIYLDPSTTYRRISIISFDKTVTGGKPAINGILVPGSISSDTTLELTLPSGACTALTKTITTGFLDRYIPMRTLAEWNSFVSSGNVQDFRVGPCGSVASSCLGSVPANAAACSGNPAPLNSTTSYTAADTCDGTTACQAKCNAGYHVSGGVCVVTPPASCNPLSATITVGDGGANPYQICNCQQLQSIPANSTANYQLASNVVSSIDCSIYGTGAGFTPLSNFGGIFDGNGKAINNVYIYTPGKSDVGLFSILLGQIKDLGLESINVTGSDSVGGLVGLVSGGSVTRSYVTGQVSGHYDVGGLVGGITGNITNSYATAKVSGAKNIGGLVGTMQNSRVTNSYATGKVSCSNNIAGGLVGLMNGTLAVVSKCYATGQVTGSASVSGGLVGELNGDSRVSVTDSFATGQAFSAGLVGALYGTSSVTNSYWDVTKSGQAAAGCSATAFSDSNDAFNATKAPLSSWDFTSSGDWQAVSCNYPNLRNVNVSGTQNADNGVTCIVPKVCSNLPANATACGNNPTPPSTSKNYTLVSNCSVAADCQATCSSGSLSGGVCVAACPAIPGSGTSIAPYTITTCAQLQCIPANVASTVYYQLGANVDCSATSSWNSGQGFAPIVNFGGKFDGKNYAIDKLYINRSSAGATTLSVGLFGTMAAASKVSNLGLTNVNISASHNTGNVFVGALAASSGSVTNSYVTGTVTSNGGTGGLVGVQGGPITSSYSSAIVTATTGATNSTLAGGLVAVASPALISKSYATGKVTGGYYVGGLAGMAGGGGLSIIDSYATGKVTATGAAGIAGGLVGALQADVKNSYATGAVSGSVPGGLIGDVQFGMNSTITNCFATGSVGVNGGGLFGSFEMGSNVSNSHWDKISTGKISAWGSQSCGGGGPSCSVATTTAFSASVDAYDKTKAPLSSWNFTPTTGNWQSFNCNYPTLQNVGGAQNSIDGVGQYGCTCTVDSFCPDFGGGGCCHNNVCLMAPGPCA